MTIEAKEGFMFMWVLKCSDSKQEAFLKPFTDQVKNDSTTYEHLEIIAFRIQAHYLKSKEIMEISGFPYSLVPMVLSENMHSNKDF